MDKLRITDNQKFVELMRQRYKLPDKLVDLQVDSRINDKDVRATATFYLEEHDIPVCEAPEEVVTRDPFEIRVTEHEAGDYEFRGEGHFVAIADPYSACWVCSSVWCAMTQTFGFLLVEFIGDGWPESVRTRDLEIRVPVERETEATQ